MYIKIRKQRINFNNVLSYNPVIKNKYDIEKRKHIEELQYLLNIDTVGENEDYGGFTFIYDTEEELNRVIDKLDTILVKEII